MRLWIAMMLGCCAMVGFAQDAAPEEVAAGEEVADEEGVPAEAHKEGPSKPCGCGGKPR